MFSCEFIGSGGILGSSPLLTDLNTGSFEVFTLVKPLPTCMEEIKQYYFKVVLNQPKTLVSVLHYTCRETLYTNTTNIA